MSLSAQQPSQTPIIASGLFNFRHIAPIFLVPHAPHTTLSHIDLTPVPRALMRIVPAPPRPPTGTQPMTTPTTSVATRIAAAILCACFGMQALADPGDAASPTAAAETTSHAHIDAASLRPFTIAGEIIDEHGNPAPGVTVTVLTHAGEAITDELGRYIIDTRIPFDADSISIVASLPDERTGQRITTRTAAIEHDAPFIDAGVLEMRSTACGQTWSANKFCTGTGIDGEINAMTVWDDGSGPALYVGGLIYRAGCVVANNIARWDGHTWQALGSGVSSGGSPSQVYTMIEYQGSLIVGGNFGIAGGKNASRIARWDGTEWYSIGGISGVFVSALEVFQGDLIAAGRFTSAGGVSANSIARWNGTNWHALQGSGGNGLSFAQPPGHIYGWGAACLTVVEPGNSVPAGLYVGGLFSSAGGVSVQNLARWDGAEWHAIGGLPLGGYLTTIASLAAYEDGFVVGGSFVDAGGAQLNRIAMRRGASWLAMGTGASSSVGTLLVKNSDEGTVLYAAGGFATMDDVSVNGLAVWDGESWSGVTVNGQTGGDGSIRAVAVFDDGVEPRVYLGGTMNNAFGMLVRGFVGTNGTTATHHGEDPGSVDRSVLALQVMDDGSGPALYAGGTFTIAGAHAADRIARWDGTSWSPLSDDVFECCCFSCQTAIHDFEVFDDGSGPALYAVGRFRYLNGMSVNGIARWNGSEWSAVGNGITSSSDVNAIVSYDDGTGAALYVGAESISGAGSGASRVRRWDGTQWTPVGSIGAVRDLVVHDDGSGPTLYAASGASVLRWNGTDWQSIGIFSNCTGTNCTNAVFTLASFDDGWDDGPALYAGGRFTTASGVGASRIARWNGVEWMPVPGINGEEGLAGINAVLVQHIYVMDPGPGGKPMMYISGNFRRAGGNPGSFNITTWDGDVWRKVGTGFPEGGWSYAFAVFDDGSGPALYTGGSFSMPGGVFSKSFAEWRFCPGDLEPPPFCPGDINGDGVVDIDDFIILAGNFGSGPGMTPQQGDLNDDGFIDIDDFIILAGNFGNDCN